MTSEPADEIQSLGDLLDRVHGAATASDPVAMGEIFDAVGKRTFSPLLLLAGLVMVAPIIGDIPGVPILMGGVVIIVSVQLMLNRDHLWLPGWLERPAISSSKVRKVVDWLRRPAAFVDKWTRPRLEWAVRHVFMHLIAMICIVTAAATPIMEFVPFSANFAGLAISAFALALFTRDGLIALVALAGSVAAVVVIANQFL